MKESRPPAVAGTFYPAAPEQLLHDLDTMLRGVTATHRPPKAIIVPHAGYVYSGPVAASAFATLLPSATRITRVVLLGPAHRVFVRGLVLPEADALRTPIGTVNLDLDAIAKIPDVPRDAAPHAREHSLEVELPFLIRVLPLFQIVPLAVGDASPEEVAAVLDALWGGPETLVVISSDLSHYLPYDVASRVDRETARAIVALGPEPILHEQACGATPVNGLILAARARGLHAELLDLRSSGDTAGSRAQVVGYGAFAFHEEAAHAA